MAMDMEISQFLTALLAIIIIDIVLAGDNAIVIALGVGSLLLLAVNSGNPAVSQIGKPQNNNLEHWQAPD